ncbi:glycosyltransferase [Aerococcaceae bacterium WGS1372]
MNHPKIKIDFICVPLSGHLNPQVELALYLQQHSQFHIRFITGEIQHSFLQQLGFETVSFLEDEPDAIERAAEFEQQSNNSVFEMLKLFDKSIKLIERTYPYILNALNQHQTDIAVVDFITLSGGIAANHLDIPWITTHPSLFVVEAPKGTPSYLGGWKPLPTTYGKIRDWMGWRFVRFIKKSVGILSRRSLKKLDFKLYVDGKENLYSSYSILGLGMKELEFNEDFPETFTFAGPCCLATQNDIQLEFPTGYKRKVLITFGTLLKWIQPKMIELMQLLAQEYPEILFIFTLGDSRDRFEKPKQKAANFWIYPFVPYDSHIPQFDYVIHQAGAGIFYQCIRHSIPSLLLPQDNDQFDYAARGEVAGIGIWGNDSDINSLKNSFKELLDQKDWSKLKNLTQAYQKYNPGKVLESEINRIISIESE